jgi:23S rRNA (guanosine2251-2'-O)-methyltransferase
MPQQYVYGYHPVLALLRRTPKNITKLFILRDKHDKRSQEIVNLSETLKIPFRYCSRNELEKYAEPTAPHQGIIALCQMQEAYQEDDIPDLLEKHTESRCILVLDGVQDPHNLGACLRTADAAGCDFVIAPKDRAVGLTPTVRKVACGAAETLPFIQVTNLARTLRLLKDHGVWLYGADGEAKASLFQTQLEDPCALILGGEENGIRRLTRELCDELVSIPLLGSVASLNVSVATGICLYEWVRQRSSKKKG